MSALVLRQCSDPRNHDIHVTGPTRNAFGEDVRYVCGGDSLGDRRIRQADSLRDLVEELDNA